MSSVILADGGTLADVIFDPFAPSQMTRHPNAAGTPDEPTDNGGGHPGLRPSELFAGC